MKFDTPATTNPIDQLKVVGKPLERIEGPLKTTGRVPYAYERHDVAPNQAYGYPVCAAIAKGRIKAMDLSVAKAMPGVLDIITAQSAGPLGKGSFNTAILLGGPEVQHYHQAIALVVADSFEQARAAAQLVKVTYERQPGMFDLAIGRVNSKEPTERRAKDTSLGDFDSAYTAAPFKLDSSYTTPAHTHAMMEPYASIAEWSGDKLNIWTSSQMIDRWRSDIALTLNMPKESIRLSSEYIGGGFGGKLFLRADPILAALGARAIGRAVKVTMPRPMIANNTTHRPATIQRIRIGADAGGKITAIGHESWSGNLEGGKPELAVQQTQLMYAGENRMTALRLAVHDLPEGNAMRAPGEAAGLMALEIAMDEMAEKLGLDPIQFRKINDTQVDPANPARPFSQRSLVECMEVGAKKFGWDKRSSVAAGRREGRWLIGIGMAAAFRNNINLKSGARVTLDESGQVLVETDMTDIGTGSYTIISQTAAEVMGVPVDRVVVKLGDSNFPISSGSGGQFGANSSTAGVYAACMKLRDSIVERVFGSPSGQVEFSDGYVSTDGKRRPIADAARDGAITVVDFMEYGDLARKFQQSTFGAHFVEVAVDISTAEIRVRRMLAVCASGRILNPRTARSQVIGGMTMGVGAALTEELAVDRRLGFFVNHDLAGYEVAVNADIPHQDVIFLDEQDPTSSPMKAKGVGELGLCGVGAAIANAVYNATGVRLRDYPLTIDKLLAKLPDPALSA